MHDTLTSLPVSKPAERTGGGKVFLRNVSWEGYKILLREINDGAARLTYDDGYLEIEVPGQRHEMLRELAVAILKATLNAKRTNYASLGSTTWVRSEKLKGIEADGCFYIGDAANLAVKSSLIDLNVDPAPDLAIEVDVTGSSIDKLALYAAIGVREVWRIDNAGAVFIHALDDAGKYHVVVRSRVIPELPPEVLSTFLRLLDQMTEAQAFWKFQDALPALLSPKETGHV